MVTHVVESVILDDGKNATPFGDVGRRIACPRIGRTVERSSEESFTPVDREASSNARNLSHTERRGVYVDTLLGMDAGGYRIQIGSMFIPFKNSSPSDRSRSLYRLRAQP